MKRFIQYGGIIASAILIAIGLGSIYVGLDGRDRVRTELAREQIVGTPDSSIPGQKVDTGAEAQAFAKVGYDFDRSFDYGLDLILDALDRRR